jgi:hypothetical protein
MATTRTKSTSQEREKQKKVYVLDTSVLLFDHNSLMQFEGD